MLTKDIIEQAEARRKAAASKLPTRRTTNLAEIIKRLPPELLAKCVFKREKNGD